MTSVAEAPAVRSRGVLASFFSTDHKRIALNLLAVSFFWFLLDGVFALLMRTELARPGMQPREPPRTAPPRAVQRF